MQRPIAGEDLAQHSRSEGLIEGYREFTHMVVLDSSGAGRSILDFSERPTHSFQKEPAGRGKPNAGAAPLEQRDPDFVLKGADPPAHRGGTHIQDCGRLPETKVLGDQERLP